MPARRCSYLCEPVPLPREVEQYLRYFCGDAANPNALTDTEALRVSFYKAVAIFVRAFADLAQDLTEAGYSDAEAATLQKEVEFYTEIRAAIKKHSGEELDIKPFEADMRHLINTYIQADPAAAGDLGELSLTELIIKTGIHDAIARKLNEKGKLSKNAIAEGIINNVRKTIIRDQLTDPRFYEQMSKLLDDLIKQSRADTAGYEEFLRKAEALVKRLAAKQPDDGVPAALHGNHEATVLYNNLGAIAGDEFSVSDRRRGRERPGPEDRPGHARECAGGLEGRSGPRGAGAECLVPAPGPGPRGNAGALRDHQEPAGVSMTENHPARRHRHRRHTQGGQERPLSVHPPDGRVTLVAPDRTRVWKWRAPMPSPGSAGSADSRRTARSQAEKRPRQYIERESHYLWGRRHLLTVKAT